MTGSSSEPLCLEYACDRAEPERRRVERKGDNLDKDRVNPI
jgi:hypothetical protein